LRKSFNTHKKRFAKKIRNCRSKDPKLFWKILNGTKCEKSEATNKITSQAFYDYFKNLNASAETCNDKTENSTANNQLLNQAFEEQEIANAIKSLRNNKACGCDELINEFFKALSVDLIPILSKFFNLILFTGQIPADWSLAIIKPLYKNKGSREDPSSYRGISILSCFGKLFTSVLNLRLTKFFQEESTIGNEQAGFRKGFSTLDHIFVIHSIINIFLDRKKRLFCLFIDYEKAFDFIKRSILWNKLLSYNVNGYLLRVIKNMYENAKSCILTNDMKSDTFSCENGVRQGENLSPLLFSVYLNDLKHFLSKENEGLSHLRNTGKQIGLTDEITDSLFKMFLLLYADDTVIM